MIATVSKILSGVEPQETIASTIDETWFTLSYLIPILCFLVIAD